jgi:hypothetical protein
VIAAGGPASLLDFLFGLVFLLGPLLVGLGVPFALLFASVRLARLRSRAAQRAAILPAFAFLAITVLLVLSPVLGAGVSPCIAQWLVVLVAAAGLALVVVVAAGSDGRLNQSLARLSLPIIVLSLALGGLGLIGFGAFNVPLQQMGEVQGIGPDNIGTFEMLSALRNQAPIAVSFVAAAVGAIAWRVTGRPIGVGSTLLGCAGIGANLMLLFLQSGD